MLDRHFWPTMCENAHTGKFGVRLGEGNGSPEKSQTKRNKFAYDSHNSVRPSSVALSSPRRLCAQISSPFVRCHFSNSAALATAENVRNCVFPCLGNSTPHKSQQRKPRPSVLCRHGRRLSAGHLFAQIPAQSETRKNVLKWALTLLR